VKVSYLVEIVDPHLHLVKVTLTGKRNAATQELDVFLPSWSPGSYLMREYSRHVRWVKAEQENGEVLWHEQTAKGTWRIDWKRSQLNKHLEGFSFTYLIYLHELTVRTSHVDTTHAYLHGPSYLVGIHGVELQNPTIEFRFPPLWSHLSTSLVEVEGPRDKFVYTAADYDELVDCPVEIGCQQTDGFLVHGIPHALAFYGEVYPHGNDLKKDFKAIVETIADCMGGVPFTHYQFITHFAPKLYGGLEHLNSTALQFDGRRLSVRKDYLSYLSLAGHEYFHAWNVKRIRPKELGPFDYRSEAYTTMLWLAEGLTSFMDDLFTYRAGVATLEEYLDFVRGNLDTYLNTPGRKFHSLEASSFNAWIKLYRPDENSRNSSVSYYLKGGLVFTVLHARLLAKGKGIDDFLALLWKSYQTRPDVGLTADEVFAMVRELGGTEIADDFISMVQTTKDIDFDSAFAQLGLELRWQELASTWIGAEWENTGDRVLVKTVVMDSPAYQCGLNAGDEILSLNNLRVLKDDVEKWGSVLLPEVDYQLLVSRLGKITAVTLRTGKGQRALKEIAVVDRARAAKALLGKGPVARGTTA
jgi:predicted metalloprotease with PDZ domain